ncbi:oxysterol-binding protein-related protein 1-like isoform X1 [Daphnia carinata]|uniref:oxysterol-binding protein-related protein 1-like isoform X1 n=1 Tax=Daphnia carinata TaxID=120202 RepID=UPI00257FED12|nr:oxysterol-binding protein-related protein 1-like isoform X1 [Daphnia carinata]
MDSAVWQHRDRLPSVAIPYGDASLWSVLKQVIGKELSKITMPIQFNEPLSFLQRLTECMEYSYLLHKASEAADPVERMQYVASFAVSGLASNWLRLGKPFNPLLAETYQEERQDFRIICEQVSHHPPVSAFHADSPAFRFYGAIDPKIKFWGKSVEIQPKGVFTIELPKWNETYTWSNVNCCVHNIIVGKLWIEQYGTMEIVNHANGYRCELNFKPAGWYCKDLHRVEGFVLDSSKARKSFLYGKWTDNMKSTDVKSYDEYSTSTSNRAISRRESAKESVTHTPRKMLAKLNSLTIGSFKHSTDEANGSDEGHCPLEPPDGEIPKSSSTISLEIPNSTTLWEADPRPSYSSEYYHFTLFAMALNELPPPETGIKICPTDSRFRPDIRLMEEGQIERAAQEKTRLEEKQRESRKARRSRKEKEERARWFKLGVHPLTKQESWFYRGGFWETKEYQALNIF